MLAVEFITNCTGGVEVLCRLLSRFEGKAKCEVFYRLLPSDTGYTDTSEGSGGVGDTLSVVLSVPFEANTVLSVMVYTVGGLQDVSVEGMFAIGICTNRQTFIVNLHLYYKLSKQNITSENNTE